MLDRRAVRRAMKSVDRVFHAAGMTSVRPEDAERMFEVNVRGTRIVFEEALRAEEDRAVYTSSAAALGPAPSGRDRGRGALFTAGPPRHPLRGLGARGGGRGPASCGEGPAARVREPDPGLRARRHPRHVDPPGPQLPPRAGYPAYADGTINVVDVRNVADRPPPADANGAVDKRYILGGRNFTFDRLFADLGRLSGVEPPVKVPRSCGCCRRASDRARARRRSAPRR